MTLALTIYSHERLAQRPQRGVRVDMTWPELVRWLSMPMTAAVKDEHGGYCIASFAGDERAKANVEKIYALGLDIDDGTPFARVCELLSRYSFLAHSTFSSSAATPKTRAILPYAEPLTAAEHGGAWRTVAAHFAGEGVTIDAATKDASRLWYVPCVPQDGPHAFHVGEGEMFDGRVASEWAPPRPAPRVVDTSGISDRYLRGALRRAADAVAGAGVGARNATLNREVHSVLRLPIDHSTAEAVLVSAAVSAGLPRVEAEKTFASAARARRTG